MSDSINQMRVSGRVELDGTKTGIADLLVTLYQASTPPRDTEIPDDWRRLGAVLTESGGAFSILHAREGERPKRDTPNNIAVAVTPANESESEVPSLATVFRRNAAGIETFLIRITDEKLRGADITPPNSRDDIENQIAKRREVAKREARIREDEKEQFVKRFKETRDIEREVEANIDTFIAELSAVPIDGETGRRYVARGDSVLKVSKKVIEENINERISKASLSAHVLFTDDQLDLIRADESFPSVQNSHVDKLWELGKPSVFRRSPPLCIDTPIDPCLKLLKDQSSEEPDDTEVPSGEDTESDAEATSAEIPILVENLVKHVSPPESPSVFSVHSRAGMEDVQQEINEFKLHSGPADALGMLRISRFPYLSEHPARRILSSR